MNELSPVSLVTTREAFDVVAPRSEELREEVISSIRQEALKTQNVALAQYEAFEKARQLLEGGIKDFAFKLKQEYPNPPWSTLAEMIINTTRSQYFRLYTSPLFREVANILQGKNNT